ncbi:glycosyltransferase [Synechococcus sp. CBW1004]|nr:glycosyltransferase [Synechococcus sp. CBW1004]
MNIAHLSTVHPRDDTRIAKKMCSALAEAGHAVTLYVADGRGDERCRGIQIVDLGQPRSRLQRASLTAAAMWRRAIQARHEILHFHDPELIPGALVARRCGQCVIYDIHEYYRLHLRKASNLPWLLKELLAWAYGLLEQCACRNLNACTVAAPHMLSNLRTKKAVVIENHVRPDELKPGTIRSSERELLVSYIGVLSKDRCVEVMVDAVANSTCRLALAGKWYPPEYRDQIIRRPGWRRVAEWGLIDRIQVQQLLSQSRAGLLIHDLQGDEENSSSNKLFEYMAAGIPVIASNLKFAREVIQRHHCGLLVSPEEGSEAVSAAIDWILTHPDEADRMGQAGRAAIEAEYDWNHMQARLNRLYTELHNANQHSRS